VFVDVVEQIQPPQGVLLVRVPSLVRLQPIDWPPGFGPESCFVC
jgi:hypothetical protein